jgi:hypothetical protein
MTMTINEARSYLNVPADKANNNCVYDARMRLREVLALAERFYRGDDMAPEYVVERVRWLKSWCDFV